MIVVVGAGPAGSLCAKEIAASGAKVEVWEKGEIGRPAKCTGLISKKGLDLLDIGYEDSVLNACKGARLYSPNGTELEVRKNKAVALVVDREKLDKTIAEEAESEGAVIKKKSWKGEGAKVLVGADGTLSTVARSLGVQRNYIHAYQVESRLETDTGFVGLYFGRFAPGFFAWVVPVDEKNCRIGVGVKAGANPRKALEVFVRDKGIALEKKNELSALIPAYDGSKAVHNNIALVGDAAAHVKATTGGGVAVGGFCARICGKVIGEGLALSEYDRLWRKEYGKSLGLHLKIRQVVDGMSDAKLNGLFALIKSHGLEKVISQYGEMESLSPLVRELMKQPRLLIHLAMLFPKAAFS